MSAYYNEIDPYAALGGRRLMTSPQRPVLRWYGGKWRLAPWVIERLPPHRIYVEPFGGAGSVLMRKNRAYAEVWNDLDHQVVNLFRVLRSPAATRLVEQLRLTPFARAEFDAAREPTDDPVEKARRLVIRSYMGFGSNAHSSSPGTRTMSESWKSTGFRANSNRSGTTPAHDWANYPEALFLVIDRLSGVVIESRDAMEVMRQHDSEQTLIYADPPYLPETRTSANIAVCRHELTAEDHAELLRFLRGLKSMVVLSGYPSALYDDALKDWQRVERKALADGARPRTEVLWLNPACVAALARSVQQRLEAVL